MKVPALPAKITRPAISGAFTRERLFSDLDSLRDCPAVWVSAPAGSGKTTLIASWLESRKIPHLWYQVDQTDSDPASFFYYMGLSAKKTVVAGRKKHLPLFTAEYMAGLPAFSTNFFEAIYRKLKPPYVLVFDNCHEVPGCPSFEEIMAKAISLAPVGIQCLLISRYEPPPRLVYLLASSKMEAIGWEDIKFSLAESEIFANTLGKKPIPLGTLQKLYEKTRGWAAGLVLLIREMDAAGMPESFVSVNPEKIFDYFANEILGKMDGAAREFLLKTSFVQKLPAGLAEKLTGLEISGKILAGLSRNNYFVERRGSPPVYQFHPLFREFLNARAIEAYSKEEISAIKKAAAALLEDAGKAEDAAGLWIQAEDWAALSALILKKAGELLNQGRAQTLAKWISSLPEDFIGGSPWLLYWAGVCRIGIDPAGARGLIENAFQQFVAGTDMAGALLCWSFIVDSYMYEWDDFSALGGWIDRFYTLIGPDFKYPSGQIEAKVASSMMCAMASSRPGHPDAEKWAEKALALSKVYADPASQLQTSTFASYFYGWRGDFKKSALINEEIGKAAAMPDISPLFKIGWLTLEAVLRLFVVPSPDKALESISIAHELGQKTGVHVWDHHWTVVAAFAALCMGDFAKADEILNENKEAHTQRRIGFSHYLYVRGYREFLAGNFVQAAAHAEAAIKYAEEAAYPYAAALCHFEAAQVNHALGLPAEAEEHIRRALEQSPGSKMFRFMCLLARAQFAFNRGEKATALGFLQEGFEIGRMQNYMGLTWWWDAPAMAFLCARALEAGIEPEYACEMVWKRNLTDYAAPLEVEDWPWPVKVYTLGGFRIIRDGQVLESHGKPQQKPLALLKLLIALDQDDVPEERITDMLWPDAEGDLAHKSFETTCARLRKIIGEKAVHISGGLVSLQEKYCWTDLKAVARVMAQAEERWKAGAGAEAVAFTERAMALYKGDFLSTGLSQPWAMAARERVKNRMLRLIIETGKYLQQSGQCETALGKFEKGLELDSLVEELYQDLMLCQINLGRHAEAARTYEKCRMALSMALGIAPSPVTEKIYKSIF